jgi:hypothetical protein
VLAEPDGGENADGTAVDEGAQQGGFWSRIFGLGDRKDDIDQTAQRQQDAREERERQARQDEEDEHDEQERREREEEERRDRERREQPGAMRIVRDTTEIRSA